MKSIWIMALKDVLLITRDRLGLFFIVGFPILMGLFFGLIFTTSGGGDRGKMKVAIVDQDKTDMSRSFVEQISANEGVQIEEATPEGARESVRKGSRVAYVLLPEGFGERAGVFWGDPPDVEIGLDPSRSAESAMLQGFVMQAIGGLVGERFQNPASFRPMLEQSRRDALEADVSDSQRGLLNGFFDSIDSMIASAETLNDSEVGDGGNGSGEPADNAGLQFANVRSVDVTRSVDPNSIAGQLQKSRSRWDISFPQAMLWGILGCIASFSISIARETTLGTMTRLQVAPVSPTSILAGKALACFLTALAVMGILVGVGYLLGMRPGSYAKLTVAAVCVAASFTGIMMVISLLGRTEQGVSGAGWAANMIMAMLGGCMVPVMFMPGFIQSASVLSPVRWAIQALEGAIWRDFSWLELATSLGVLLTVGAVCFAVGSIMIRRRLAT